MKMMWRLWHFGVGWGLGLMLCLCSSLYAQVEVVRLGNAFMQVGVCGRNEALGRGAVALRYDESVLRHSVSTLVMQPKPWAFGGGYSYQLGGLGQVAALHMGYRVDSMSVVGAELMRYGVTGIPNTLHWYAADGTVNWERISYFNVADWGLRVGYAREMPWDGLSWGVALKLMYRHAGIFARGYGLGADVSVRYVKGNLAVSANLYDALSSWTLWFRRAEQLRVEGPDSVILDVTPVQEVTLPHVGVILDYDVVLPLQFHLLFSTRWDLRFDGRSYSPLSFGGKKGGVSVEPALGVEIGWRDMVHVRLGGYQLQRAELFEDMHTVFLTPAWGVGASAFGVTLDYSMGLPLTGIVWRYTHIVSLRVDY